MEMARKKAHIMIIPLPSQGHINPSLQLAFHLAMREGISITFVNTERAQRSMKLPDWPGLDVEFATMPDGLPPDFSLSTSNEPPHSDLLRLIDGMDKNQHHLNQLLSSSPKGPVCCLVSDIFLQWTHAFASQHGIPRVVFWTSSAFMLHLGSILGIPRQPPDVSKISIPGLSFSLHDMFKNKIADPERVAFFRKRFEGIEDATCILVNTVHELDGFALDAMKIGPPVLSVGPLLLPPPILNSTNLLATKPSIATSALKEDTSCIQWLDGQPPASVLYISFGSMGALLPTQLEQVALGIEASGKSFLWVMRIDSSNKNELPEGFMDRTKDKGRIVHWAPQVEVLNHLAVAGFLTHCGWNSVLECLTAGKPMLGLPLFAEQPFNYMMIVKQWNVGLEMTKNKLGVVSKEEVEKGVRSLMKGETIKERAHEWKEVTRRAINEGGSSHYNFNKLIQLIKECPQ